MWGQTDFNGPDGNYYLANEAGEKGIPRYDGSNFESNYYMCPAYSSTVNALNYHGQNVNMPLITTLKSFTSNNKTYAYAIWYLEAATGDDAGYYYIKHVESGKYLVANDNNIPKDSRRRVNLLLKDDNAVKPFGDFDPLFKIQTDDGGVTYYIRSKTKTGSNKCYFLNPSYQNYDNLNAQSGNDNTGGIIGFWSAKTDDSAWHLMQVPCDLPVISYDNTNNKVTITSTEGATIYYTTDGTTPDPEDTGEEKATKVYDPTNKPTILATTTVKAIATKSGYVNSEVATQPIEKLVNPSVAFVDATQKVTITKNSEVEGATSVYTINGDDPAVNSTEYSEAISLTGTTTVKAMNVKDGYINSDVVPLTVTKLASSPTISISSGTVTLEYTEDNTATIYYTTDGSTPIQGSSVYSAPFSLGENSKYTIKAIATKAGSLNSDVKEQVVDNRSSIPAPTITYTYNTVTITASDYGDEIYYTIDGNDPTTSTATHFTTSGSFDLDYGYSYTIKAIASNGEINSLVATETIDLTDSGYAGIYYIHNTENGGEYYMYPVGGGSALVTTAKKTDQDAIWKIERVGDYYRIIHYQDGKYLVAKDLVNGVMPDTETVSLVQTDSPGENALFQITRKSGDESDILQQIILIRPKAAPETIDSNVHNYLNKRGGNTASNPIGLWNNTGSSQWTLVTVPAKPIITVNDINVTISSDLNNVYYTTDGTTNPTKDDNLKYNGEFTLEYGPSYIVKAVCIYHDNISGADWTSEIATSDPIQVNLLNPIITSSGSNVTIDNSQASGVTFRYTFSDDGSLPEDPVPGGAGEDYTSALPLTANARNAFKAIAYNIVDGTPYTSDVVTFDVDFRSATTINSLADITSASGYYKLGTGFSATGTPKEGDVEIGTSTKPFKGIIDGNLVEFELGSSPLFDYVQDATIKNVIISKATISTSGNAGAIANNALGVTRIYNCGVLATGSTVGSDKDGYTEITTCSSTISGSGYVGGIVGLLDGSSRVINCFSYANITGGNKVGGIVGWNNVATTSTNLATMVMNCMFYGDITGGDSKAPIYNGEIITNDGDANGVNNFNYFWAGASYVQEQEIDGDRYNCALSAETRFLQRFEFFRHLLNSNRALAAWWATGDYNNKDEMMKWVMEPSKIGTTTPYPILKAPKDASNNTIKYPSVVNIDADHADSFSSDEAIKKTQYNQGRKFGTTFTINIRMGTSGDGYHPAKNAAIIEAKKTVTPNITDKDPKHFNFNYYKVQLPYYNDVGTNNYNIDDEGISRVVTGWKIVSISDGTHSFTTGSDATASVSIDEETKGDITLTTPYNFADRKSTAKDLYSSINKRVFNQGAYFDVPEGVTSIIIEPYWGKCVYVSDEYPDVVYKDKDNNNTDAMYTASNVTTVGGGSRYTNNTAYDINGNSQKVYTSMGDAVTALAPSGTVYDNAIVLVGNVHSLDLSNKTKSKPYTIMSIDLDKDNEPDYSYILRFNGRTRLHPVRVDFLNVIGLGMAQKSSGGTGTYNFGIMQPYGWFECTNTGLFRVTQFEYDLFDTNNNAYFRDNSPMILHGGVIEQWVTVGGAEDRYKEAKSVTYYHIGSNVWFKEFHIGVHQDKNLKNNKNPDPDQFVSPHPPISVTGGDFDEFYLTGLYNTPNNNYDDNAECYINGGRFGKVSGTGMQGIGGFTMSGTTKTSYSNGNIIWQIDNADIDEFYAGGINAAHIAEGNIYTVITNSRVDQFCGGPKFGNMNSDKVVVTNAENCTFRAFFGAGYGGNSYNRRYPSNQNDKININWNTWLTGDASYNYSYDSNYGGVETRIDYQFLPNSGNTSNVCRLFVDHISFSLATTHDITSKLTGCTITTSPLGRLSIPNDYLCLGSFYGGGSLGKVDGPVKSTLTNCIVKGNVFGAGYSATLPVVKVMNQSFQTPPRYDENLGAYLEAELPSTETYNWRHRDEIIADAANDDARTALAIDKNNNILYTNEDLSKENLGSVSGAVTLTITTSGNNGETIIGTVGDNSTGHVYGGGDASTVINTTTPTAASTTVYLKGKTQVLGNVFGGGNRGKVSGTATVNIEQ